MNPLEEAKNAFFAGMAAVEARDYAAAETHFRRSLELVPDRVSVLTNLAGVLVYQARPEEAAATALRATALDPKNAEAWLIVARARRQQSRASDALAAIDQVVAIRPGNAESWATRGGLLAEGFRFAEAATAYDEALRLDPDLPYARGDRLHARMRVADWRDFAEERAAIVSGLRQGRKVCRPGPLLSTIDDPELQLISARQASAGESFASPPTRARYGHTRIRVAYLSPDLRDHPVTYLAAGLFEEHDRDRFETVGISTGVDDGTALRRRVAAAFDTFTDADGWSDTDLVAWIRRNEVDILVDLAGHTQGGRDRVFGQRPAPVQVNYLGYPGTSGDPSIDYIIADPFLVPPGSEAFYTEKVVRLPDCFQANDDRRGPPASPSSRLAEGLPAAGFVFCCFNNTYKLNPDMFDVWMRLLTAVPASVLWTVADDAGARHALRREAERRGVRGARLVFARRVLYADHLARLRLADLFLDTLPFNAGTTGSDALRVGLPLVTCAGRGFAARMAGSLLRAIGLPDLVTESMSAYEALALRLATASEVLAEVRDRLSRNRPTAPLFDTARFTRRLEAAYLTMWERAERGLAPASFAVPAG
jgi:protein O-GlcNAc transferase